MIVSILRATHSCEADFLPGIMAMSVYQIAIGYDPAVLKSFLDIIRLDER